MYGVTILFIHSNHLWHNNLNLLVVILVVESR